MELESVSPQWRFNINKDQVSAEELYTRLKNMCAVLNPTTMHENHESYIKVLSNLSNHPAVKIYFVSQMSMYAVMMKSGGWLFPHTPVKCPAEVCDPKCMRDSIPVTYFQYIMYIEDGASFCRQEAYACHLNSINVHSSAINRHFDLNSNFEFTGESELDNYDAFSKHCQKFWKSIGEKSFSLPNSLALTINRFHNEAWGIAQNVNSMIKIDTLVNILPELVEFKMISEMRSAGSSATRNVDPSIDDVVNIVKGNQKLEGYVDKKLNKPIKNIDQILENYPDINTFVQSLYSMNIFKPQFVEEFKLQHGETLTKEKKKNDTRNVIAQSIIDIIDKLERERDKRPPGITYTITRDNPDVAIALHNGKYVNVTITGAEQVFEYLMIDDFKVSRQLITIGSTTIMKTGGDAVTAADIKQELDKKAVGAFSRIKKIFETELVRMEKDASIQIARETQFINGTLKTLYESAGLIDSGPARPRPLPWAQGADEGANDCFYLQHLPGLVRYNWS